MDYFTALNYLRSIRQEHLLIHWNTLLPDQQMRLLEQIKTLDLKLFREQKSKLFQKEAKKANFKPFLDFSYAGGHPEDKQEGCHLIEKGALGCLIVAGGQGSRLGIDGPKGAFPVSLIKHKTLFQLAAEKILAASRLAKRPLKAAIMTSPLNHDQTVQFFMEHHWFGLDESQIEFYQQSVLPLLNMKGDLFLESPDTLAVGPDGNGSSLQQFIKQGLWQKWHREGIRFVNYILIDNALADPFDQELLGFHVRKNAEVTIKCTERNHTNENVGLLVEIDGQTHVVEYSEFPREERESQDYLCANMSNFCLSMDFVKEIEHLSMPLHAAHKAVKMMDDNGQVIQPKKPNAWKFEKFIFDILPAASHVEALLFPRSQCFAPLKNLSGNDSLKTVQVALQQKDREIIASLTGLTPPDRPFELSQAFYYPDIALKQKWLGKKLPETDYIEP